VEILNGLVYTVACSTSGVFLGGYLSFMVVWCCVGVNRLFWWGAAPWYLPRQS